MLHPTGQNRCLMPAAMTPAVGKLIEFSPTEQMFERPKEKLTESYLRGTFS